VFHAKHGSVEIGGRAADEPADYAVLAVPGSDLRKTLVRTGRLPVWGGGHVAVDQRVHEIGAVQEREFPFEFVAQSAFFGFEQSTGVVGDQTDQDLVRLVSSRR